MTRSARVVVDPSRLVAELDRRVFGSFVEHVGRCVSTGIDEPDHPEADGDGVRFTLAAVPFTALRLRDADRPSQVR